MDEQSDNFESVVFKVKPQTIENNKTLIDLLTIQNQYYHIAIDNGKWQQNKMKQVCPVLIQWPVERLYLYKNLNPCIIKDLSFISSLHLLTNLNLQKNNIASIQALTRFNAPNLLKLYLNGNLITSLKSFRKYHANSLVILELRMNLITQNPDFFESNCKYLKNLRIDCLGCEIGWQWKCGQQLKWETKSLKDIGRSGSYQSLNIRRDRMASKYWYEKMQAIMKKKYVNLQILVLK